MEVATNQKVILLGAKSEVAREIAILLAPTCLEIVLVARGANSLEPLRDHLQTISSCQVTLVDLDVRLTDEYSKLDPHRDATLAIVVFGYLGDQELASEDLEEATQIIEVNFQSAVLILNQFANAFRARRSGTIVGISSVAGERGRKSNYIYGSAKAGLTAYLAGLRNDLFEDQVHVMTVKPGFMATRMTEHLDLPKHLTASPKQAATAIVRGVARKKNVVYVRWHWALIMFVIRSIPEPIFKRLNL